MALGWRACLALALIIVLTQPAWPSDKRKPSGATKLAHTPYPADIYSRRALRRARTILMLKLLDLREAHLERVRKAIERRLPIEQILDDG